MNLGDVSDQLSCHSPPPVHQYQLSNSDLTDCSCQGPVRDEQTKGVGVCVCFSAMFPPRPRTCALGSENDPRVVKATSQPHCLLSTVERKTGTLQQERSTSSG